MCTHKHQCQQHQQQQLVVSNAARAHRQVERCVVRRPLNRPVARRSVQDHRTPQLPRQVSTSVVVVVTAADQRLHSHCDDMEQQQQVSLFR